jgi:cell division septation protein DedD
MDEDMQAADIADFEIERRLDSYARARLSPDPRAVDRIRARVMREARLHAHMPLEVPAPSAIASRGTSRVSRRRVAASLLAASLTLGIMAGSVAAAEAGGPLYPARVWLETVVLPADGASRAVAEIARLDTRIAEAGEAAATGNGFGVEAALGAYRVISDQVLAQTASNPSVEGLVADALERHRAVLRLVVAALWDRGNTTAAEAVGASIDRTIAQNAAAVAHLRRSRPSPGVGSDTGNASFGHPGGLSGPGSGGAVSGAGGGASGADGGGPGAPSGAAGGGSGPGAAAGGSGGGGAAATPKPVATPNPTETPNPVPTAAPAPTAEATTKPPQPAKSARPTPSPAATAGRSETPRAEAQPSPRGSAGG